MDEKTRNYKGFDYCSQDSIVIGRSQVIVLGNTFRCQ